MTFLILLADQSGAKFDQRDGQETLTYSDDQGSVRLCGSIGGSETGTIRFLPATRLTLSYEIVDLRAMSVALADACVRGLVKSMNFLALLLLHRWNGLEGSQTLRFIVRHCASDLRSLRGEYCPSE